MESFQQVVGLYFKKKKLNGGGYIVAFDVPRWFADMIESSAVPQENYTKLDYEYNNQEGRAPKKVDPSSPRRPYELPGYRKSNNYAPWNKWIINNAIPGSARIIR